MKLAVLLFCLLYPPWLLAQSQKPLLLGLASISGGIETLYVTKKIGAFKRNGIDVDFLLLQGGSQALQVLLSGEIKLISGGGGTAAQRARFKGAGNLLVATYTPTMPYSLYVNRKIQDGKQLKGAKIAISRFGSSSDFAARFMVTRLGLDPAKDVTIMQVGNQRERMSALPADRSTARSSTLPILSSPASRDFPSSPTLPSSASFIRIITLQPPTVLFARSRKPSLAFCAPSSKASRSTGRTKRKAFK